ncbi:MAG TPA: YfhO family protein [Polyangia bacterium]|nr:YfhO family protein [Polyangia bacterium]
MRFASGAGKLLGRFETPAAVASIVALILSAFWKLTLMKGVVITDDVFASDLMNENFPYRFALGAALRAGHWPLWVRELYGGFPLLARSEAGVCYPFNLVLFGLLPPYVALNLTMLLTLVTAGVGMYLYAREIGGDARAGLLGAVAFAFSGFLIAHLKHLSMANGASWLPVALLLLERAAVRGTRRPLVWFAVVFGLQHLAGNPQVTYYCGVLYLLYFPLRLRNHHRASPVGGAGLRGTLAAFAAALGLGCLLAAVQLLPTYQLVSLSQRAGGVTFDYASRFAYDPASFWTFLVPYARGDVGNGTYVGKGIFWEDFGYVGVLTFLLAVYATWRCRSSWHVRFFATAAAASYVLVLGPATPVYRLVFHAVPGMSYFRFPTRLLLITDASLIALAALGLTHLGAALAGRRLAHLPALAVVLTAADLLFAQLRQNPIADLSAWTRPPVTAQIVGTDPSLFRVFSVGGVHAHRRAFQAAGGWQGDLQPFVDQRELLQPSSNVLYGLASPNGYANLIPNYLVDVWGDQNRAGVITHTASTRGDVFQPAPSFWKLMRMYDVKYLTSFWPFAPSPQLRPLGLFGGAFLYRNADLLPRARLVGDVTVARDDPSALQALTSEAFDPARAVLLEAVPPGFQPGQDVAGGAVDLVRYGTNDAELQVRSPRPAILVFSDSYYPGWLADVDGRATAIYRANVTQRAVLVPAGQHRVRFRFAPTTVAVGASISLASALVLLACLKRWSKSSGCRCTDRSCRSSRRCNSSRRSETRNSNPDPATID